MANRTSSDKRRTPLTRLQKGKRYALLTLALTGAYSTYANVRSGQLDAEPVVTSVLPTVVFFVTVHLLSYFSPKNRFQKTLVWFGLGLVAAIAFGISGIHIWELTVRNGQLWWVALFYPFIVDVPSALATVILIQKVSTNANGTTAEKTDETPVTAPTPQKRTTAAKKTAPAKATTSTKPTVTTPKPRTSTKPSVPEQNPQLAQVA